MITKDSWSGSNKGGGNSEEMELNWSAWQMTGNNSVSEVCSVLPDILEGNKQLGVQKQSPKEGIHPALLLPPHNGD